MILNYLKNRAHGIFLNSILQNGQKGKYFGGGRIAYTIPGGWMIS